MGGGGGEKSNPLGRVSSALRDPSLLCVQCALLLQSELSQPPKPQRGQCHKIFLLIYFMLNKANAVYSELNEFNLN